MSPGAPARSTRSEQLLGILRQAGLEGRVHLGLPTASVRAPGPVQPSVPPGAEERFSPDALLRPLRRPEQGELIELVGPLSSGRTALACRMAAGASLRGELVGWVDLPGCLDPRSLRRCGVELRSVLWVRPARLQSALRSAELLLKTGLGLVVLDLEPPLASSGGSNDTELDRLGPSIWTRLARAARAARSTLLLLAPRPLAGTQATLGLETGRGSARFESGLLEGFEATLRITRQRSPSSGSPLPFRLHHRPGR